MLEEFQHELDIDNDDPDYVLTQGTLLQDERDDEQEMKDEEGPEHLCHAWLPSN